MIYSNLQWRGVANDVTEQFKRIAQQAPNKSARQWELKYNPANQAAETILTVITLHFSFYFQTINCFKSNRRALLIQVGEFFFFGSHNYCEKGMAKAETYRENI